MKKLVALILALTLLFSFAACGQTPDPDPVPGDVDNPGNVDTPVTPEEPVPEVDSDVKMESVMGTVGEFTRYTTAAPSKMTKKDMTTLWVGQTNPIESGNPHKGSDSPFYDLVFDKLIQIDFETGEYVGDVFKEFEMAEDNSYMTFTMHDNIVFHDGTKATVEDVFYTLQRCTDPALSQQADKNVFGNIDFEKCESYDDYSGKIALKTPSVTFVAGLTKCWLLCKDYIESVGEEQAWWSNTIGSGPYRVEDIIQGDRFVIVRNDSHWTGETGPIEKMVFRFYAEPSTMYIDYETGNLDMIINPVASDIERVVNGDITNTICDIHSMISTYSMVFNEEKNPILQDINVRKAVCLAIDAAVVTEFAWDFLGMPATSVVPRGLVDSIDVSYAQDIEAAQQALADAGYKPGELKLVIGSQNGASQLIASESVQAMLEDIGIVIEMIVTDPSTNLMNMRNAGPDVYDMSITMQSFGTLESANMLGGLSQACGSVSMSAASDPKIDEIALKARNATSVAEKQALIKEFQQCLADNYWMYPLCEAKQAIIYRDYLTGIRVVQPRMADLMHLQIIE